MELKVSSKNDEFLCLICPLLSLHFCHRQWLREKGANCAMRFRVKVTKLVRGAENAVQ